MGSKEAEALVEKVRSKFVNRLLLCFVVICYLWLSSLQMAVVIVTQYTSIVVPAYNAVFEECKHMYASANEQKELYNTCVSNQVKRCNEELEYTITRMLSTQNEQISENDGKILLLTEAKSNCSAGLAATQNAMNAWTSLGVKYSIPYNIYNCSDTQIASVKTFLSDYSPTTSSLYSTSLDYSEESDQTVNNLVTYVNDLDDYNENYFSNKSSSLQIAAKKIVIAASEPFVSSLNSSFSTIDVMLDRLIACMGIGNASEMSACDMTTSSRELYDSLKETINTQNSMVRTAFDSIEASLNDYVSEVESAIDNANSFYDSVASASGIIAWIINTFDVFNMKSQICGKTAPDWCDFSPVDWYVNAPTIPSLPSLANIPDATYIWGDVQDIVVSSAYKNISSVSNSVVSIGNQIISKIETNISSFVELSAVADDYSPPIYSYSDGNITNQVIEQKEKSSIFKQKIIGIISDFTNNSSSKANSVANNTTAESVIYNPTAQQATYSFQWLSINFEDFNIEKLIVSFASLQNLLFLFDYIYRTLKTIKLVRKYWNKSAAKFPVIDLSYDNNSRKKRAHFLSTIVPPEVIGGFKLLMEVLPFIYVQLLLVAAFSFMVLYAVMVLYVPAYYSYVGGCVQGTANNTYLSSKMYPLAYNYASSSGNSNLAEKISQYNSDVQSRCSKNSISSQQTYNQYVATLKSLNSSFNDDISNRDLLSTCVNMGTMALNFESGCCAMYGNVSAVTNYYTQSGICSSSSIANSTGDYSCPVYKDAISSQIYHPYKPPEAYLRRPEDLCRRGAALGDLSPVRVDFNCTLLPTCSTTCEGPDNQVISRSSKTCSCTVEWFVHSNIMQSLLSVWVYLLMNMARALTIKGMIIIFWKAITPKIFDFLGSCDKNGQPIDIRDTAKTAGKINVDETNVEDGDTAAGQAKVAIDNISIKVKLDRAIYRHERKGWMYLVIGLLLNSLWMLPLYYIQSNINYSSTTTGF